VLPPGDADDATRSAMNGSLRLRPSAASRGRRTGAVARDGAAARPPLRRRAAAWLVLVVGSTVSVSGGLMMRSDVEQQSRGAFTAEASDVGASIASSLARMNDLTVTMRTFVATHPETTNRDWAQLFSSLDITQRYPGAITFAYVEVVPRSGLADFVRTMKADPPTVGPPNAPYAMVPPGNRPYYCLVRLGKLSGPLAAIPNGLDVCAVSQGTFMERIRDSGQLAVTAISMESRPLAEITAPVYRGAAVPTTLAARRAKILGVVGGVFDVQQILSSALRSHPGLSVALAREDYSQNQVQRTDQQWLSHLVGSPDTGVVGSAGPPQSASAVHHDVLVSADGEWLIRVSGPPRSGGWSPVQQGIAVGAVGLLMTVMLASLVAVLTRGRQRALDLVVRRTSELASSEERFRSLAASSPVGILQTDDAGRFLYGNERLCTILGRAPAELGGTGWSDAFLPEDRQRIWEALGEAAGAARPVEARVPVGDDARWVRFSTAALAGEDGEAGRVSSLEDVTAEILNKDRLTREARHDALTGLPNRVQFLERLTAALRAMPDTGSRVGVLFIDLDRFKQVNDAHGHAAGDELLVATARRISGALRPGDLLARLGGDEFAVLLGNVDDLAAAAAVVDRLQAAVEQPFVLSRAEVGIGASVGLVLVDDPDGDPATILQDADMAMYRAKSGSTRFEIFDVDMRESLLTRMETEQSLAGAVEREELTVEYQPFVDLASGALVGCEALVRWQHPSRGRLLPGDFLPLAESTGRIVPIGEWVLGTALRALGGWIRDGHDLWMSVNVSAQQLAAPRLLPALERALAEAAVDPGRLCIEVLETHLLDACNVEVLQEVRRLGVRVAIDDFGAGYSGLLHLKRLPADIVKIDRRLVADLAEQSADRVIVGKVVEMAHDLGMRVLAEGVEQEHQRELLASAGCDLAQGWLWSPAVPPADLGRLLQDAAPWEPTGGLRPPAV
jgi:diguanylate cyclase (GGDEF)-like protein/PAS domain S-box-containing protein